MGVLGVIGNLLKLTLVLSVVGGAAVGGLAATNPEVADTLETTAAEYLGEEGDSIHNSSAVESTATPSPNPSPTGTPSPEGGSTATATPLPEDPVLTPPPTSTPEPTPTPTPAATPTPVDDAPQLAVGVDEPWDDDSDPDDPGQSRYETSEEPVTSLTVEYYVHRKINERRARHDLPPMEASAYITSVSRAHSEDMAARSYFDHTNPDGEGPSDRFEKFPDACGAGYGENIAANFVDKRVQRSDGSIERYRTNEEVAQALVEQWMNSTGHRKNILTERWEYVGTGIYITEGGQGAKVYATQNFCATRD